MYQLEIQSPNVGYSKFWFRITNDILDRPFIRIEPEFLNKKYYLKDDIHEWLKHFNIQYELSFEVRNNKKRVGGYYFYYISFENKSDAILFKLTWM